MMVLDRSKEEVEHRIFENIIEYINPGDTLVLNDTKVIPARLFGHRVGKEEKIEILLLKQQEGDRWQTLVKPGKKCKIGEIIEFSDKLKLEVVDILEDGQRVVEFKYDGIFNEILDELGTMPLPPYITQKLEDQDRYQTVYSKNKGSAAAPTAGLHFTKEVLKALEDKGVNLVYVTLHVGLGTFRPVKVDDVTKHDMHSEYYIISQEACDVINETKKRGNRVIAVGTTSSTTHTATTYYTTNGSVPSATNGTAITEDTDVTLTLTCTVKAITISTSGMQSKMVSYNFGYVAPEEVSAPTIALKEGVENVVTITVGNTNHEDEIATTYYTTDGSMPSTENGTAITEDTDVTLSEDCTVQAITISSSGLQSAVALYRFTYVAPEEVSAPAISLKEGVENVITISVGKSSREAETATTYYTTDGSQPSATNGTAITEDTDVELTEDCTVKAITISTSGMQSEVVSYDFTYIAPEVPEELTAPAITKKEGVRNTITISVGKTSRDTETATTYYTTDGSQPSATNGTVITADTDVELSADCTVKAITISTSGMQSEVVTYDFTFEQESGINMSTLNPSRENQAIYDLQGRKVTTVKRGALYITNGKKAVIR